MSVKLYMDEHVPSAVTVGLRVRDADVLTVQEDGMDRQPDSVLMDRATAMGRLVVTFDPDFLREAHRRQIEGSVFSGVVFARQTRISIGELVRDLHLIAECGTPQEVANQVIFLPL